MNLTEAITIVRRHNEWRRGDGIEPPQPYKTGQALDALCDHAERLERELAACKHGTMLLEDQLNAFDEKAIEWWCEYQDLKAKARQP